MTTENRKSVRLCSYPNRRVASNFMIGPTLSVIQPAG